MECVEANRSKVCSRDSKGNRKEGLECFLSVFKRHCFHGLVPSVFLVLLENNVSCLIKQDLLINPNHRSLVLCSCIGN